MQDKFSMASAIAKLNRWTQLYDEGIPEVTDAEWDRLYFRLQEEEKRTGIVLSNSPTSSITYDVVNSLEKVTHNHPMLSLAKTKDWNEFCNYFKPTGKWGLMLKYDGLTCSLMYKDGKLVAAETRGNGEVGENILHNVRTMPSVPQEIPAMGTIVIDGEVICTYKDFEAFKNEYANPRNFAAGSIRLLDANECAKRKLTFMAWRGVSGFDSDSNLERLGLINSWGFNTTNYAVNFKGSEEDAKRLWREFLNAFPNDGFVGRIDSVSVGEGLGETNHHSRAAFAFKFQDDVYDTILRDIVWSAGRTGVFTPVAIFDPVDTGDSIIEKASLHNLTVMENLGIIGKGQRIQVAKMNEIIPQVVSADRTIGYKTADGFHFLETISIPDICPICGESLEEKKDYDSAILICTNSECDGKFLNHLEHFAGKKGLDIKGLSLKTLAKLMDWGWITELADIFTLKDYRTEWCATEGFGVASVDKILNSIATSSKGVPLEKFICSLGIPLIGATASKVLVKHYKTFDSIVNGKDFTHIEGFGDEMNYALTHFDFTEARELLKYITLQDTIDTTVNTNSSVTGKTFVITGSLTAFKNRDALVADIESKGGKVVGSVSKNTDYLINNDSESASAKNSRAKALGVKIITEAEFLSL